MSSVFAQDTYTIYPIPHTQQALPGTTTFTPKVTIVADAAIDQVTINRANLILADHGLEAILADAPSATNSNLYYVMSQEFPSSYVHGELLRTR